VVFVAPKAANGSMNDSRSRKITTGALFGGERDGSHGPERELTWLVRLAND